MFVNVFLQDKNSMIMKKINREKDNLDVPIICQLII